MEPAAPTSTTWQRIVRVVEPHQGGRFAALDGYRAVAAIGVLVYHVAGNAKLTQGTAPLNAFLANLGNFGVAVFFLLSGFLLYRGFVFSALTDEQLAEVLSNSDVMCCLRRPVLEGASASVIEGMLSGRPTVVVDDGFYGELPNEYVVKVPPAFDSSDLARVLERLMSVSAEQRLARGREAKAWASEEFSVDRYVEVMERVLRKQIRMGPYLDLADQVVARLNWLGIDSSGPSAARFAGAIDSLRRFDAPSPHKI